MRALAALAALCAVALVTGCAAQSKLAPTALPGHPWAYCDDFNDYCATPPRPV